MVCIYLFGFCALAFRVTEYMVRMFGVALFLALIFVFQCSDKEWTLWDHLMVRR